MLYRPRPCFGPDIFINRPRPIDVIPPEMDPDEGAPWPCF